MSEKIFEQISNDFINTNSVTSLATRPNQPSSYGTGGLNATQLKQRFDALPKKVIEKYNEMAKILSSTDALSYLKVPEGIRVPDSYDGTAVDQTLSNLLRHIVTKDGEIAATSPITYSKSSLFSVLSELYTTLTQKIGDTNSGVTDEVDRIARLIESILDDEGGISADNPINNTNESLNKILFDLHEIIDRVDFDVVRLADTTSKELGEAIDGLRDEYKAADFVVNDRVDILRLDVDDIPADITHAVNVETVRATEVEADLNTRLTEVSGIAKGATRAKTFLTYAAMVEELLQTPSDTYNPGQGFLIATVNVPDLWVYGIIGSYNEYEFQSDEDFVNELKSTGVVHIGYFLVSALETQKVDLSTYVEAYVGVEGAPISNPCSGTSVYYDNTYGWAGIAYLSSTIPLTKEQLIGTKWTLAYKLDSVYTPTEHEITKAHLKQETDDGLWFCVDSAIGLHIFVAFTTNFKPDICLTTLPSAGVYLSESYIEYSAYIVNVTPWLSPRKMIDNRLIDLKNHPDFIIPEPDLTDYVKFTNEPGNTVAGGKPGVVGLNYATSCGLRYVGNAGKRYLTVYEGNSTDVLRRNGNCVITLATMDDRIKTAIVGAKEKNQNGSWVKTYGNQPTLTDEEKASAQKWLGTPRYYSDLYYAPLGGHGEIAISFSDAGQHVNVNGREAYLQTTEVYPPDALIGANVTYYNEKNYNGTIAEGYITSRNKKGYTVSLEEAKIYVVYEVDYLGINFPSPGIYFTYLDDGDLYYVSWLYKAANNIRHINNVYLDLDNNATIKALIKRIEALENK